MAQKRLLVTGASGYLGRHLVALAAPNYQVHAAYFSHPIEQSAFASHQLDLTNPLEVETLIKTLKPQAIIHAAANNPGSNETTMMQVNRDGSRFVAQAAAQVRARLVHVSSDALHNGKNAPYADDAPPTPLNLYGQSKAAAEQAVITAYPDAVIVRTSLIYGLSQMDRGTAGFVDRLNRGEVLKLFRDQIRQPVWVETLATALLKLAFTQSEFSGWLNVAGSQAMSRLEFARKMLAWWGIETAGRIIPVNAADLSSSIPLDTRLNLSKAQNLLQMPFPGVDDVFKMR